MEYNFLFHFFHKVSKHLRTLHLLPNSVSRTTTSSPTKTAATITLEMITHRWDMEGNLVTRHKLNGISYLQWSHSRFLVQNITNPGQATNYNILLIRLVDSHYFITIFVRIRQLNWRILIMLFKYIACELVHKLKGLIVLGQK